MGFALEGHRLRGLSYQLSGLKVRSAAAHSMGLPPPTASLRQLSARAMCYVHTASRGLGLEADAVDVAFSSDSCAGAASGLRRQINKARWDKSSQVGAIV